MIENLLKTFVYHHGRNSHTASWVDWRYFQNKINCTKFQWWAPCFFFAKYSWLACWASIFIGFSLAEFSRDYQENSKRFQSYSYNCFEVSSNYLAIAMRFASRTQSLVSLKVFTKTDFKFCIQVEVFGVRHSKLGIVVLLSLWDRAHFWLTKHFIDL